MGEWMVPEKAASLAVTLHPLVALSVSDSGLQSLSLNVPCAEGSYLRASFVRYFLSTYYMLGTVLGAQDEEKSMTGPQF